MDDATSRSTIASMINRFRMSAPTDPATRRRQRSFIPQPETRSEGLRYGDWQQDPLLSGDGEPGTEVGNVARNDSRFWWMEERDRARKVKNDVEAVGEDEEGGFEWIPSVPFSSRRRQRDVSVGYTSQQALPSLDDLIARDVEEFANSTRLSQELRRQHEHELTKQEFDDANENEDRGLFGEPIRSGASPKGSTTSPKGSTTSPKGSTTSPKGSTTSPKGSTTSLKGSTTSPKGIKAEVIVVGTSPRSSSSKQQQQRGVDFDLSDDESDKDDKAAARRINLFDSTQAQEAIHKAHAKLLEMDKRACVTEEQEEEEEEEEEEILLQSVASNSTKPTSTMSELASRIDMDLFALKMSSNRVSTRKEEDSEKKIAALAEEEEVSVKPSEAAAYMLEEAQAQIRAIAAKARERGLMIENELKEPPRPLQLNFDEHEYEHDAQVNDEYNDDQWDVEESFRNDPLQRPRQSRAIPKPRCGLDALYRHAPRSNAIPEQLDIAMLRLNHRLHKRHKAVDHEKAELQDTGIGGLKRAVAERIHDIMSPEGEASLPPLPNDFDASAELLTARLRAATELSKTVPHAREQQVINPDLMIPQHRALYNAFHARDWDEDGLVMVQDARTVIMDLAQWAGQPVQVSDEDVLIAAGLLFSGPHASKHLSFLNLVTAFDAIVKAMPAIVDGKTDRPEAAKVQFQAAPAEGDDYSTSSSSDLDEASIFSTGSSVSSSPRTDNFDHIKQQQRVVYAEDIRRLADQLRRAEILLDKTSKIDTSGNQQTQIPHSAQPQSQPEAGRWQGVNGIRPPPYNPHKMYVPSAPKPFENSTADSVKLEKNQVVLNLTELQAAVQSATIEFYKRRSAQAPADSMAASNASSTNGSGPRPLSDSQRREPLPPMRAAPVVLEPLEPQVDFQYHEELGVSHLRVRGLDTCTREHEPRQQAEQPSPIKQRASLTPSHFTVHERTLNQAWTQLSEFEALRQRLTRRVAF